MKNYKNIIFYLATIGLLSLLIVFFLGKGKLWEAEKVTTVLQAKHLSNWDQFKLTSEHNVSNPLAILLLQIITIIITARIFGFLFRKIGQPTVIGEIIAGIFLGPSFIGLFFPQFSAFLFPVSSFTNLQFLSQIGLILFMFIVGMELDIDIIRKKAQDAVLISHASIIFPFALGIGLSYFLYTEFATANTRFLSFALFLGIAMSITAFPVLARIVQERGLTKTKLGAIVITCAAIDDITAWCLLAAVIAIVKAGSIVSALFTILLATAYVLLMLKGIRPFLQKLGNTYQNKEGLSKQVVAIFFITLIVSSYCTEILGIHALFGAFMAGVIMPTNINFRNIFIEKVEDISLVLLLPLFFVYTGLRTQIGLLNDIHLWGTTGIIILVAVTGKFIGSSFSARFTGQSWSDSFVIGSLMNTRGLMELVVLNIGYDLGILSPAIFAMMVIMALFTTFMTGPALHLIEKLKQKEKTIKPETITPAQKFKILLSFGNPQAGAKMLHIAKLLFTQNPNEKEVVALHMSPVNDLNDFNEDEYTRESFRPIDTENEKMKLQVEKVFKASLDINNDIIEFANSGHYNLLIVGFGQSVFDGTLIGKIIGVTGRFMHPAMLYRKLLGRGKHNYTDVFDQRINLILSNCQAPVGVFLDRGLTRIQKVALFLFSKADSQLSNYLKLFLTSNQIELSVFYSRTDYIPAEIKKETSTTPPINFYPVKDIEASQLQQHDLLLISSPAWEKAVESQYPWMPHIPSVLIIRD